MKSTKLALSYMLLVLGVSTPVLAEPTESSSPSNPTTENPQTDNYNICEWHPECDRFIANR